MNDIRFNQEKFRKLIDSSGLSNAELSDKIGFDKSLINRHYNADKNRPISVYYLEKYCNYFNVSPNYFYDLEAAELSDNEKKSIIYDYTGLDEEAIEILNNAFVNTDIVTSPLYDFHFKSKRFIQEYLKNLTNHSDFIKSDAYKTLSNAISVILTIKNFIEYIINEFDINDKKLTKQQCENIINFIDGWEREYKFKIFNYQVAMEEFAKEQFFEKYSIETVGQKFEDIKQDIYFKFLGDNND